MKALSRNNVTATILGREGLLTVMTEIITKLSAVAFGPKLKVSNFNILRAAFCTKSFHEQLLYAYSLCLHFWRIGNFQLSCS